MINLSKGQKVSLAKENGGVALKEVIVGLGWDQKKPSGFKSFFSSSSSENYDLDAFALLLNEQGKLSSNRDIVYFSNKKHESGAVIHHGDNLTGEGDGDDEVISVDLQNLPASYSEIVFAVNIYQGVDRKQDFGQIENAFIHLVNADTGTELCEYNLSYGYEGYVTVIFGKLYKHNGDWKFDAMGNAITAKSVSETAALFR